MSHNPLAILRYKKALDTHLTRILSESAISLKSLVWSKDSFARISKFVVAGKSVRGCLVLYTYAMFQKESPENVINAASALELFHAGLLIHDDIMDRDTIRRGMPTLHSQYEQYAAQQKGTDVPHFGESQAINIADLCYFLGYKWLAHSGTEAVELVSRELSAVVLAQMQDVSGGHIPDDAYKHEDVVNLYRYKTARYTFSLPMQLGSLLAHADTGLVKSLGILGECFGLLYQIRDDELNSEGNVLITGKSTGTDAANHKQTLATVMTKDTLEAYRRKLRIDAQSVIRTLPVSDEHIRELMALLRFCEERNK